MGNTKWGKEGPNAVDFGWIVVKFIGMLIVKMFAFLIMRAAWRYFKNKFASLKQKNDGKEPVAKPLDFDFDFSEEDADPISPPSRNERTDSFERTLKSEDVQHELKKWAENYKSKIKTDRELKREDSSSKAGKRLLEKIRERHKPKKE
ncbi:unnamed protein product [Orchesella dallaii]|uniref:Uncharacterized protein n=1 Tax=Orchesella dallaii TaxID=48710 RepID=A0ABP1QDY9_9HEXA